MCHANKSELRIVDVWSLRIYICGHWKLRPITSSPTLSSFPLRRRTSHFWYIAEENKLYLDDILYPSRSCFLISQNVFRNRSLVIFHLSRQVGVRRELLMGKLYINRTRIIPSSSADFLNFYFVEPRVCIPRLLPGSSTAISLALVWCLA